MPNWKRVPVLIGIVFAVLAICYIAFYFVFLDLVVDLWWFQSLQYEGYFWLRLLYRYFISGGVTLLFFLIFFINFWVASRYLGVTRSTVVEGSITKQKQSRGFVTKFQSGALDVYSIISLILAIIIALPFYEQWEESLLFLYAPSTGIMDPLYQNDVSFYLFSFPVYQLIQKELLIALSVLFISIAVLYWIEHRVIIRDRRPYPFGVKVHLTGLIMLVFLAVAWGFMLQRFGLLYVDQHEPVFYGPGFVEIRYHLPLIWTALTTFLATALSAIVLIHSHGSRGKRPLIAFSVLFAVSLALRHIPFIPDAIDKLIVQPNPVKAEKSFMENNITATVDAYDLVDVKTLEFEVTPNPEDDLSGWVNKEHLQNIPVWDRELLDDVYNQLQGIRPYYRFLAVDEDRYLINDHIQQVNLGAREMNISKLPQEAKNWENTHLRYTHGFAGVMTPAAQDGGQPIDWYLRDLNLHSSIGLKVENPDIYYGMEKYGYAIVPNELNIVDISGTSSEASKNYSGSGGIPIRSWFRKLLFAVYYKEKNIFFSRSSSDQSHMLLRRNVRKRVQTMAPYLALDNDPYLVVTDQNFYWILDAYTVSNHYPISKPTVSNFKTSGNLKGQQINYIRNSVKVVVDAYSGSVDFYIADPDDPIIKAYHSAYPGVFKRLDEIPKVLKSHLRYPRDIFYYQMGIYSKYHQIQPELFYQQAETWSFPSVESVPVKPYFLTTEIEGCPELDKFILIEPMTPIKRDNLSVLAIAGSLDFESCGVAYANKIAVYKFRKDVQVDGPAQISALIDQDPVISEQFTLWDQHGSKVTRGRMVIMPLGHSVLYVQPIYLISTNVRIPELARVIVSMGNEVVMDKTLENAFAGLEAKLRRNSQRQHNQDMVPSEAPVLQGLGPSDQSKTVESPAATRGPH